MEKDINNSRKHRKQYLRVKVIIFYGYNGSQFQGSQYQKDTKNTVEFELEQGLLESDLLSKNNFNNHYKTEWNRGSRTDKGVHALCNNVSCKLEVHIKYIQDYVESENKEFNKEFINFQQLVNVLNSNLNNDIIKVFDIKPVLQNFDVKKYASDRYYQYVCPLHLFSSSSDILQPQVILQQIKELMQNYLGTKKFHNFTIKVQATDEQAKRQIRMMDCQVNQLKEIVAEEALIDISQDQQQQYWVRFWIQGNSFMYHQIRKMIGLLIQVIQQNKGEQYFNNAFMNNKMYIWLAPADGLYQERIVFNGYNIKSDVKIKLDHDQNTEALIENFRKNVVLKQIISNETKDLRFTKWKQIISDSEWDIEEFI